MAEGLHHTSDGRLALAEWDAASRRGRAQPASVGERREDRWRERDRRALDPAPVTTSGGADRTRARIALVPSRRRLVATQRGATHPATRVPRPLPDPESPAPAWAVARDREAVAADNDADGVVSRRPPDLRHLGAHVHGMRTRNSFSRARRCHGDAGHQSTTTHADREQAATHLLARRGSDRSDAAAPVVNLCCRWTRLIGPLLSISNSVGNQPPVGSATPVRAPQAAAARPCRPGCACSRA